jgi:hypothetical protein
VREGGFDVTVDAHEKLRFNRRRLILR